jgi:hypothetical protein
MRLTLTSKVYTALGVTCLGLVLLLHCRASANDDELLAVPSKLPALDIYGGYKDVHVRGTGYFRVEKVGNRWTFVTPDGNAFWMRSIYYVVADSGTTYGNAVANKYGISNFPQMAGQRMQSWGFNSLADDMNSKMLPVSTYWSSNTNPVKMPFLRYLLGSDWAERSSSAGGGNVKEIVSNGVNFTYYTGWRGQFPDVFDPAFATFYTKMASDPANQYTPALTNSPWLIGTVPDDADSLFGFKDGPGCTSNPHPHLAWIVAVTSPKQTSNSSRGASYSDTAVYTKLAWRDYLKTKYSSSLSALNSAWGSNYTTWDSTGTWGSGTGLLDEDGRHAWMGKDIYSLTDTNANLRADLDAFLGAIADKYFSTVHDAIKAYTPNHMVFGPASLGTCTRPQILKSAGKYIDVLEIGTVWNARPELLPAIYDITKRPMVLWTTYQAQSDSAMAAYPGSAWPELNYSTQALRGQAYAKAMRRVIKVQSGDGSFPVIGIKWWQWNDNPGEHVNFGLVSLNDQPYDGKALGSSSNDGKVKSYGDFLSYVRATNLSIHDLAWPSSSPADSKAPQK